MLSLAEFFPDLTAAPTPSSYIEAIDTATDLVSTFDLMATKAAEMVREDTQLAGEIKVNPYVQTLGGIAQLWKAPQLGSFPQHPSSLGQVLVMGGLGALGGKMLGRLADRFIPENDYMKAERAGMILGGLLGATPGLAGAYMNATNGKPAWTSSFYQTKSASFGDQLGQSIMVSDFQDAMWSDPRIIEQAPLALRAAASGLVMQAANLPGRHRNSPFVTPQDIARVAIGAGSGAASGWLVGKTLGMLFGTGQKTQDQLRQTGAAVGALKAVIPLVFDQEPYGYN